MVELYNFQHLPKDSVDLSQRIGQAVIGVFEDDTMPLTDLVSLINEYASSNYSAILSPMFDMALRGSIRNTDLLMKASRFFGVTLMFDYYSASVGIAFQPLPVVEFIMRNLWDNCTNIPSVYEIEMDQENYLLDIARKNTQPYVSIYATFLDQTNDDEEREIRRNNWRQLLSKSVAQPQLDLLQELSHQPNCRLAYLVQDIRDYIISPFLENFLLYV